MNKYERDVLTTNGIVGTSCRLQTFGTSLLGLFNHARAVHLWILVARKWQQDATCSEGLLPFSCYFLLGFKDVEGKTGKSWEITNIPKHSQTIYIRILPPTSTYIHESYQAASVPWVPSGCTFSDAISLGSVGMPLPFTSATWWKRAICRTPGMI